MLCASPLHSSLVSWQWPLILRYFLSFNYLFSILSLAILQIFAFSYDSCCFFVNNFFSFFFLKLIIKMNAQNFLIHSLPLYTSCLFFMHLNEDIVDIEKPDGICSLNFFADEFSGLFLHPLIFSIIHSRSA